MAAQRKSERERGERERGERGKGDGRRTAGPGQRRSMVYGDVGPEIAAMLDEMVEHCPAAQNRTDFLRQLIVTVHEAWKANGSSDVRMSHLAYATDEQFSTTIANQQRILALLQGRAEGA